MPPPGPGVQIQPGLGTFPLNPDPPGAVAFSNAFGNQTFELPTFAVPVPGLSPALVVGEKTGRIWLMSGSRTAPVRTEFLNLRSQLSSQGSELGMLGLAFDPDFGGTNPATRDVVYVSFTRLNPMRSVLSRFRLDPGAPASQPRLNPASEQVLLEILQPFGNHNGGHIEFDHSGMLLMSAGDGGAAGDPFDNSQDLTNLLGKMLRIDVRGTPPSGQPYGIPSDNPFVTGGPAGVRREIWSYGLRNPWRFSVDPDPNAPVTVWVGDVGQGQREEINLIRGGENHGWRVREGELAYTNSSNTPAGDVLVEPLLSYGRGYGACVIGGRIYDGTAIPSLKGRYIFGDYSSARVIALAPGANTPAQIGNLGGVVSFHEDYDGEMLVVSFGGAVYRMVAANTPNNNPPPTTLSAAGVFADTTAALLTPAQGMLPYEVASPFWSGPVATDKGRLIGLPSPMSLPDPGKEADGLKVPIGTVVAKHFESSNGYRLETRVMVLTNDGWRAYTYIWRSDQSDADLNLTGATLAAPPGSGTTEPHIVPSGTECFACHRTTNNHLLGISLPQWDAAQRARFIQMGLLPAGANAVGMPDSLAAPDDMTATPEQRAHGFLAANCSSCHRPETGLAGFDLRATTPLANANLIGITANSGSLVGLPGAPLIAPGDPNNSVLLHRAFNRDATRMPPAPALPAGVPLGPSPSLSGLEAVRAWISGL